MIKNKSIMKLILIFIIFIFGGFIYFEYLVMDKYFKQNIKNEQNIINNIYKQYQTETNDFYYKRINNILSSKELKNAFETNNYKLLEDVVVCKFKELQNENIYIKK